MVRIIALFVFLTSVSLSYAQIADARVSLIESWHSCPVPADSATIEVYSHDTMRCTVFVKNGSAFAIDTYDPGYRALVPADSLPPAVEDSIWKHERIRIHQGKTILPVDDGFLIGFNGGEFGAGLYWYSNDGRKHLKISDDEVIQIIRKDGRIFAIQGLAHLSLSQGSVIEIMKTGAKWTAREYLKLPFAPFGIAVNSKDELLVGTSNSLIAIKANGQMASLIDHAFWGAFSYLYPNSMVIRHDVLYIGMRKGIFKYDLTHNTQEWLTCK